MYLDVIAFRIASQARNDVACGRLCEERSNPGK